MAQHHKILKFSRIPEKGKRKRKLEEFAAKLGYEGHARVHTAIVSRALSTDLNGELRMRALEELFLDLQRLDLEIQGRLRNTKFGRGA